MKKSVFYIAITLSVVFLINIIDIVINDAERLTQYGWGYLSGQIVLFGIFVSLAFFMLGRAYGNKQI
ncbi:hypothetical protein [Flavobacterium sp.]|uniref:hypothetical protein n=1 Tax=Flavobacterium sp. TaxID=239 RepID=UPI0040348CBA